MTITANAGPYLSFGQGTYADYNPDAGPSLFFSGAGLLDPRSYFTYQVGSSSAVAGWLGSTAINTLNIAPAAASATALAAAQATTAATAMTLVSSSTKSTGVAASVAINRSDTGANVTGLVALDAFAQVSGYVSNGTSGTAGNLLIVTTSSSSYPLVIGMTITGTGIPPGTIVTGYGPATGTSISGVGFTGVYTVSGAPFAAGTSGSAITISATQGAATGDAVASCRVPFGSSGIVQPWNPQALSARAVSITPVSANPTGNIAFTVRGYDVYGVPMSEAISLTAGSTSGTAVNGKKAFKYVTSITPDTTDTVTYSAGTTNIFGFPLRSDDFGDIIVKYAAALNPVLITVATNYVGADATPATTTTGDVRGTYTNTPAIGARRFAVAQSPYLYNVGSVAGLYGVTQA